MSDSRPKQRIFSQIGELVLQGQAGLQLMKRQQQDLNNAIFINGSRYYNGSTAVVKLDFNGSGSPALLENIASISWMEQEQHRPIYGYADRYFKYASAGQHIVEGRIMYVVSSIDEVGTILRAVKSGQSLDGTGIILEYENGLRVSEPEVSVRPSEDEDIMVPGDIGDLASLTTDELQQMATRQQEEIWGSYKIDINSVIVTDDMDDSPHMGNAPYGQSVYNIIVEYGSMLDNSMMGNDDPDRIISSKMEKRRDIIKGVLFSPPSVQLDDTGRPGAMVRSFIAQRVSSSSTII